MFNIVVTIVPSDAFWDYAVFVKGNNDVDGVVEDFMHRRESKKCTPVVSRDASFLRR